MTLQKQLENALTVIASHNREMDIMRRALSLACLDISLESDGKEDRDGLEHYYRRQAELAVEAKE
jgi:hypothetical protein